MSVNGYNLTEFEEEHYEKLVREFLTIDSIYDRYLEFLEEKYADYISAREAYIYDTRRDG